MRYFGKIISAVALLASVGCVSSGDVSQPLSINQLLANRNKFDGRAVVVVAYVNIEFEINRLCDDLNVRIRSCISLTYNEEPYETEQELARYDAVEEKWRAFHGKRVVVRGTFTRYRNFGMYAGELNHITGAELAP